MIEIRDKESQAVICRLEVAQLQGINLRTRRIRYADLTGANLHLANMHRADLWGSDFRGADLRLADLSCANLGNADLSTARLAGVNLDGARYNPRTRWPEGFSPQEWGAVLEDIAAPTEAPPAADPADEVRRKTEQLLAAWRSKGRTGDDWGRRG